MKKTVNEVKCKFSAISENESFARSLAVTFASQASPTITQLADIKCAVSEAVTNCIVHAYRDTEGIVEMILRRCDNGEIVIIIKDKGIGIPDIAAAREPLFTTDTTGERSGMGFSIMENMMDSLKIRSAPGKGTTVTMKIKVGTDNSDT